MGARLLEVNNLKVAFPVGNVMAEAVRGVSFEINTGDAVGVLGESGSGKSVTALAILRLIPSTGRITEGSVKFAGEDILSIDEANMRRLRGRDLSMVFQDPLTAFNPALRIGRQLLNVIRTHTSTTVQQARTRALEVLDLVGLPNPARVMRSYPHELSGGMRQRALIGIALACNPKLLIADEPTTALDVTIQAQIVDLFHKLRSELDLTLLYITPNLDLMAELCDRAIVMYAGNVVEEGKVTDLFQAPRHPYTRMLIDCVPRLEDSRNRELTVIKGMPPTIGTTNPGCRFSPRCPSAVERCHVEYPQESFEAQRRFSCWNPRL